VSDAILEDNVAARPFVVVVRHNLVVAIRPRAEDSAVVDIPTKLEIGTRLAASFQKTGCIDGTYMFQNANAARVFASLCTEFTQAILTKRLEAIRKLPSGSNYEAA
jgi:hypothetical protein